jgi:hypothetical protein
VQKGVILSQETSYILPTSLSVVREDWVPDGIMTEESDRRLGRKRQMMKRELNLTNFKGHGFDNSPGNFIGVSIVIIPVDAPLLQLGITMGNSGLIVSTNARRRCRVWQRVW